mmetsp:Transcript_57402/g.134398  ORF Transcript_57402/g.134398 Transcript_57402/m.134398 type:complete len:329 (+) Transcript_57402:65-1051(+)
MVLDMAIVGLKDRQMTHDSQESFHSEASEETSAETELHLREQLQQMRKRNASLEMEKAEAKARSQNLEDQVKTLSSLLVENTQELKEAQEALKDLGDKSRPTSTAPSVLTAEVTRLQARLTEELALRKAAQYDVIEKSKFICELQSDLVVKEAAISKLNMELTILRKQGAQATTPAPVAASPTTRELSPSPNMEDAARRASQPSPASSANPRVNLDHQVSSPINKRISSTPCFAPAARSPDCEVKVAPKPSGNTSNVSPCTANGKSSPPLPVKGGVRTWTAQVTTPAKQPAVASVKPAQASPVVRSRRLPRHSTGSASATLPRSRVVQ